MHNEIGLGEVILNREGVRHETGSVGALVSVPLACRPICSLKKVCYYAYYNANSKCLHKIDSFLGSLSGWVGALYPEEGRIQMLTV
jgi:hypothetical protein